MYNFWPNVKKNYLVKKMFLTKMYSEMKLQVNVNGYKYTANTKL